MIQSVTLTNFQKWKKLRLAFTNGVNVIVGPTDCGKSSVIRGLRFACLNKLASKADDYVNWNASRCGVAVVVDDKTVKRVKAKGRSDNAYFVDGAVYRFDSVKRNGVPADVVKILKMDSDNFQRQMDAVFWLAEGNAQIARNLNQIVNLEVMDRALAAGQKRLRTAKMKFLVTKDRLQEIRSELKSLEWVNAASDALTTFDSCLERLSKKRDYLRSAGRTVSAVVEATRARDIASTGLLEGKKAIAAGRQAAECHQRAETLREMLNSVVKLRKEAVQVVPDIKPLLEKRRKADAVAERRRNLEVLVRQGVKQQEYLLVLSEEVESKSKELKSLSRNVVCPKCKRPMNPKSVQS